MILVDTVIWADHIARPEPSLARLLREGQVATHPFVIGEMSLGNLRDRRLLGDMARPPHVRLAFDAEVLSFIERHALHGSGIGYVDAHLIVATRLSDGAALWTRDRRLHVVARRLGVAYDAPASS